MLKTAKSVEMKEGNESWDGCAQSFSGCHTSSSVLLTLASIGVPPYPQSNSAFPQATVIPKQQVQKFINDLGALDQLFCIALFNLVPFHDN